MSPRTKSKPSSDGVQQPLITPAEAAIPLGVTERWVRRAIHDGRLPHVKVGKHLRLRPEDVQRFIDAQTFNPLA